MQEHDQFEMWAVVEQLGHKKFAGFVTERTIGSTALIQIDVPEVESDGTRFPAFTKLIGPGTIYAITPCTEETARQFAVMFQSRAFAVYEAPRLPAPDNDDEWPDASDFEDGDEPIAGKP